jgi:hypothetical protein
MATVKVNDIRPDEIDVLIQHHLKIAPNVGDTDKIKSHILRAMQLMEYDEKRRAEQF